MSNTIDRTLILNYQFDPDRVWFTSDIHFGHVHSGPMSNTGLDHPRLQYLFPRQYDVGVDNNDVRPVSFAEVSEKIEAQVRCAQKKVKAFQLNINGEIEEI